MTALHFLRPHWLWALLALPALWALWRMRQRRGNVWNGVVDAHLLPHLLEARARRRAAVGFVPLALAAVLAAAALPPSISAIELPDDPAAMAARLYAALRELDALGVATIVASVPESVGLGEAIADRLQRAGGPRGAHPAEGPGGMYDD